VPEWASMPSEWKFVVYSSIIEVHFKHSDCILCAFQIFGHILVTGRNVLLMLKTFGVHSKWRNIERHLKCILTAFWLLSKYFYNIPTTFQQHSTHSDLIRGRIEIALTDYHFESCLNVRSASRMSLNAPQMHLECCRNLIQYEKNSAGMHFKCRRKLSIAARMQLELQLRHNWWRNSCTIQSFFYVLSLHWGFAWSTCRQYSGNILDTPGTFMLHSKCIQSTF